MEELSHSRLVIQGFNQVGKRAIGMIHLELIIGELTSNVLFHVIDAKTTYNMLLGCPWIHENGIVPSTSHQCFKYIQGGGKKVNANLKPFTKTEAHFADAKFYVEDDVPNEVLPVEIPPIESKQNEKKHVRFIIGKDTPSPKEGDNHSSGSTSNSGGQKISTPSDNPPFLCYVPLSCRKKGQSPFTECLQSIVNKGRPPTKLTMEDVAILKENHTMPLTSSTNPLPSKPLNGFMRSSQSWIEHSILPSERTKEWFDQKAYRLLAKVGYDFSKQGDLGKLIPEVIGEKVHGLSKTQRRVRLEGHEIPIPKIGLGYTPEQPAQIWIKKRSNASSSQYITVEVGKIVRNDQIEEASSSFHITVEEGTLSDVEATNEEVDEAPSALEDEGQATVDELKEINLGTTEESRPTFISALLTPEEEEGYLKLLVEYKDVFAWTYKEMPGFNPSIALHHLVIKKGVCPVKQAQRCFRPKLIPQIETEVNKLIEAGFIREVQYPEWIANIVPIKKRMDKSGCALTSVI
ncbi:uncharacterized protein LOC142606119 [Castanea sativa]|uniref:uncharacterized protein LOC142606119 n=1 Tax=Castanea sativa TaxID=21020 RepID=UPI003F64DC15